MQSKKIRSLLFLCCLTLLGSQITGCDSVNTKSEEENGSVALQFKTVTSSAGKASVPANTTSTEDALTVNGSNGSLQIDDVRFIVEKFKFEFEDDGCEAEDAEDSGDCEEFEAEPFFVDLPLNDDTLNLARDGIKTGLYKEMEFEVKDLDFENEEEEGEGKEAEHKELANSIRSEFPAWPDEASMVIVGTFTPQDGDPRPFKVFAKAEIEIEREFDPPLEVTEDNKQKIVSVRINPARWLQQNDGTVIDLSAYDWDENQELLEFSAKFKDGVEEIEVDEEDFEDDDD